MHTFAGPPFVEGEHLVENSAKLKVLDKLITKVLCALASGGWPCLHPPCVSSRTHPPALYSAHGHM